MYIILSMKRSILAPAVIACAMAAGAPAAFADCAQVNAALEAAMSEGEIDRFEELLGKALKTSDCPTDYRTQLARKLSLRAFQVIQARAKAAGDKPSITDLEMASRLARPWQVMVTLGDAYHDQKDWKKAFYAYEAALNDMADESANPKAPPEVYERHAKMRADFVRSQSQVFLASSRGMRGEIGGSTKTRFRTFSVEAIPVPVQYEFNEARLTEQGLQAADEILTYIGQNKARYVKLFGHTDPIGTEAYNMQLSHARATSLAAYLQSKGYGGRIDVIALGESKPAIVDDPAQYSEEELHRRYRRVEFVIVE